MLAFIRLYSGVYPLTCWRFSAYMLIFKSVLRSQNYLFFAPAPTLSIIFASAPAPDTAIYYHLKPVLGIRIHMDPELLPGSGSKSGSGIIVLDLDPGKSERADK